jgi:hypothetical protein
MVEPEIKLRSAQKHYHVGMPSEPCKRWIHPNDRNHQCGRPADHEVHLKGEGMSSCRACPAEVIWAKMVDGTGEPKMKVKKDGSSAPISNPLDPPMDDAVSDELLTSLESAIAAHAVMFSPKTGNGMMLATDTYERARRWWAERRVTFHTSHFSSCPARAQFRETKS